MMEVLNYCSLYTDDASCMVLNADGEYILGGKFDYLIVEAQKSFGIPKVVIRIRISKKDRKHNCQKKNDKGTNNDLMENYRSSNMNNKTGNELRCSGMVNSSCSPSGTHCVTLFSNPMIAS